MKKVLIAIDYNGSAKEVAEKGFELAGNLNAEVALVHVVSDPAIYTASTSMYSPVMGFEGFDNTISWQLDENLKKEAKKFLNHIAQQLGDASIKTFIKDGDFADSVLDTVKEWNADVIVMGSHSHSGLERLFLGSVVENVLLHTKIPMFIIPTKENQKEVVKK
jgi:nucleotide-binding universal stress UspA family protein